MLTGSACLLAAGTLQFGSPHHPTGAYTHAQCEALNRQRNVDLNQQDRVTQAIMCDTQPACATEMLYAHEFYWDRHRARRSTLGASKCHLWRRDQDWPTVEPLLSRSDLPTPEGLLTLLRLLPNKTVWFHGDSITTQLCEAAFCSLMRDGAIRQAATPRVRGCSLVCWRLQPYVLACLAHARRRRATAALLHGRTAASPGDAAVRRPAASSVGRVATSKTPQTSHDMTAATAPRRQHLTAALQGCRRPPRRRGLARSGSEDAGHIRVPACVA